LAVELWQAAAGALNVATVTIDNRWVCGHQPFRCDTSMTRIQNSNVLKNVLNWDRKRTV